MTMTVLPSFIYIYIDIFKSTLNRKHPGEANSEEQNSNEELALAVLPGLHSIYKVLSLAKNLENYQMHINECDLLLQHYFNYNRR